MLIIISDIHMGDGTCATSIKDAAFKLFSDRLQELAKRASWRDNGKYQPIEDIHILLMGDILDILHTTSWLANNPSEQGFVRPWTDYQAPEFPEKIKQITQAILENNSFSVSILKNLAQNGLRIPRYSTNGSITVNYLITQKIPVHLHYMVGNHDWYYHLPGQDFDSIRREIINAFGLDNAQSPFPHELSESPELQNILDRYRVFARHGDIYDHLNYDVYRGRNFSSLGDAFSTEIINRFPLELEKIMGGILSPEMIKKIRELVNIRPVLATSLWINGLLHQYSVDKDIQVKIKNLWNKICDDFLSIAFVRSYSKRFQINTIDGIKLLIKITDKISFNTLDEIVSWIRKRFGFENRTFTKYALQEKAFLEQKADFIVYGHTHYHEIVPLDIYNKDSQLINQVYINSGTWHPYYDLTVNKPEEQEFIPYQVMSYIAFFKDGECGGKRFETWKGAFSE
jgi:UDP-2,3-diacylglucosamine pyrophosphatase LpxH